MSKELCKMNRHTHLDGIFSMVVSHFAEGWEDSSEDISIARGPVGEEVDGIWCDFVVDHETHSMGEDFPTGTSEVAGRVGITFRVRVRNDFGFRVSPSEDSESDSMRPRTTRILESEERKATWVDGGVGGSRDDGAAALGRGDCCRGARVIIGEPA
jgi:hypothetical protein